MKPAWLGGCFSDCRLSSLQGEREGSPDETQVPDARFRYRRDVADAIAEQQPSVRVGCLEPVLNVSSGLANAEMLPSPSS